MINSVKAKVFLILIGAIWGSLIIAMIPILFISYVYDRLVSTHSEKGWLYSLLIAQDHIVNAVLGGHYLTTVSSMLGHLRLAGSATGALVANVVDWGFKVTTGQFNHCVASIQADDIHNWSASRALLGALIYFSGLYALRAVL